MPVGSGSQLDIEDAVVVPAVAGTVTTLVALAEVGWLFGEGASAAALNDVAGLHDAGADLLAFELLAVVPVSAGEHNVDTDCQGLQSGRRRSRILHFAPPRDPGGAANRFEIETE